jgi:hypothetical protein
VLDYGLFRRICRSRARKLDGAKGNSMAFYILTYLHILMKLPIKEHMIGEE